MTHVLHRAIAHRYPTAVSGHGIFIRDETGKDYIDASGGAAVSCLGHSHPEIIGAMRAQLDQLEYAHTSFFTSQAAEELADELVAHAPEGLGHAFLRQPFAPLLIETHHVSPVYEYRERGADETSEAYGERLGQELDAKIGELGGENVMAFVAETVVGATMGAVPAVPGYFKRVREICDRHGILLVLDEVMCGMGRTGTLHACDQEGVTPDILAIAKGLGGGYAPIGAMLLHDRIFKTIADGSGAFAHSHTYTGHPLACAAALAVQRIIRRDGLLANVREQGEHLARRLQERFGNHPFVGNVRGRGLFQGLEIVADRGTKKPFDAKRRVHAQIKREAMARGLMVYPMGGTVDGGCGDHVLLAPPFIIDSGAIDTIVERLGDAIDAAIGA